MQRPDEKEIAAMEAVLDGFRAMPTTWHQRAFAVGLIANFFGNMPEAVHNSLKELPQEPCGNSKCNCHEIYPSFFEFADRIRKTHKEGTRDKLPVSTEKLNAQKKGLN